MYYGWLVFEPTPVGRSLNRILGDHHPMSVAKSSAVNTPCVSSWYSHVRFLNPHEIVIFLFCSVSSIKTQFSNEISRIFWWLSRYLMVGYPNSHDVSGGIPMLNPVSCCSPSSSLKMQRANGTCDAPDFGHSLLLFFRHDWISMRDTPMTHAILVKLVYLKGMKHWHCGSKHWCNNFETSMFFSWLNHPHVASCILSHYQQGSEAYKQLQTGSKFYRRYLAEGKERKI